MEQTKIESFVESWVNIFIGFPINYVANIAVLPIMYNPDKVMASAFWIGVVFTVISVLRSYILRRTFNGKRFSHKIAARYVAWRERRKWNKMVKKIQQSPAFTTDGVYAAFSRGKLKDSVPKEVPYE